MFTMHSQCIHNALTLVPCVIQPIFKLILMRALALALALTVFLFLLFSFSVSVCPQLFCLWFSAATGLSAPHRPTHSCSLLHSPFQWVCRQVQLIPIGDESSTGFSWLGCLWPPPAPSRLEVFVYLPCDLHNLFYNLWYASVFIIVPLLVNSQVWFVAAALVVVGLVVVPGLSLTWASSTSRWLKWLN